MDRRNFLMTGLAAFGMQFGIKAGVQFDDGGADPGAGLYLTRLVADEH